jgi:hypothetical protein
MALSLHAEYTRHRIEARVNRTTASCVVPAATVALIERVMEDRAAEAARRFPDSYWERVAFFKAAVMDAVKPQLRGVVADRFHEYVAACRRGDEAVADEADEFGFAARHAYGGEARAQRDAYTACTASL